METIDKSLIDGLQREKNEEVGKDFKIKIKCVLTDGSEPVGNGIGPILEIRDILAVLEQKKENILTSPGTAKARVSSLFFIWKIFRLKLLKDRFQRVYEKRNKI